MAYVRNGNDIENMISTAAHNFNHSGIKDKNIKKKY